MMILAMIMIFKCLLSAIDFATRYSTRYSDFFSQPYSNPTRSQKALLAGACPLYTMCKNSSDLAEDGFPYLSYDIDSNMIVGKMC